MWVGEVDFHPFVCLNVLNYCPFGDAFHPHLTPLAILLHLYFVQIPLKIKFLVELNKYEIFKKRTTKDIFLT